MQINKVQFKNRLVYWIDHATMGDEIGSSSSRQIYEAVSRTLMDLVWEQWRDSEKDVKSRKLKRAYYFSAEFLMGRALGNNLINLDLHNQVEKILTELGFDLNWVEESEPDAALGNGGLGRLAACFMESLSSLNLPARGYGIRYRYGMFRQGIVDGKQVEYPDDWKAVSDPWSICRDNLTVIVRFGGHVVSEQNADGTLHFRLADTEDVKAIPYDMPVLGWNTDTVNTLRLWEAESVNGFNLQLFNTMEYLRAVEPQNRAEDLSRVLYPNDSGPVGKVLRLRQQYFFSSASLQDIIREYKQIQGSHLLDLANIVVVQLNDTHPAIAVPELMRILMDEENIGWDAAWNITTKVFAYTNHTVLSEALEKWPIELFCREFPRVFQIIEEIDRRFMHRLAKNYHQDRSHYSHMSILANGMVNMAHLAIVGSFSVNGVAALHTEILKKNVLKDWYMLWPQKFNNKTNGVTQRRWLKKANPELAHFLEESLGTGWICDLSLLGKLREKVDDSSTLERLDAIKAKNKIRLADMTQEWTGIRINPESLFDVQIKRLHEYKRQLLNILSVIHDWLILKDDPNAIMPPRTIFFGAKAASGYLRAKQIIHLIHRVADCLNRDKKTSERLKVIFIPNYCVSTAEILFPGAEISQQISTAGKEASGTGNMKFMMNGALTLGTMDGANIEIVEEAGRENAFIFGMSAKEVESLHQSGKNNPLDILQADHSLQRTLATLVDGTFIKGDAFRELHDSLVYGVKGNVADEYFVLTDFASYRQVRAEAGRAWSDRRHWNQMALHNIAGSGKFSSDRTIQEYASQIWNIIPRH